MSAPTLELPLSGGAVAALSAPAPPASMPLRSPPPVRKLPGLSRPLLREWLIDEIFIPAFRPRRATEPTWRWADRVGLPVEGHGRFLSRKKPHCRTFLAATTDPRIREQHVMKASRAGYTQATLVRVAEIGERRLGNVQFTCGSLDKSKQVNVDRLHPMLEHLGVIGNPDDNPDDATSSRIRIGAMRIRISGAFTRLAFTGDMVFFLVNDEADAIPDIPGIGTPADGGRSRIRGIEGAQLVSISRPGDWGTAHHRDVATGTLEFLAVPCPHCGTYQELTISGESLVDQIRIEEPLRDGQPSLNRPLEHRTPKLGALDFGACKLLDGTWDFNRILTDTRYRCVSGCIIEQDAPLAPEVVAHLNASSPPPLLTAEGEIDRAAAAAASLSPEVAQLLRDGFRVTCKQAMALSGRHLASNQNPMPADGGGPRSKRSEHNSDLISLDFDMTWGHLAKKFAERAHDPAALRNFLNEHGGIPFREQHSGISADDLAECRAAYARGTIPFSPTCLVMAADSQQFVRKWVILAARLNTTLTAWRDVAIVDYGVAATKADILALLARKFPLAELAVAQRLPAAPPVDLGATFAPEAGIVDAGGVEGNNTEVYELYHESSGVIFPCFGESTTFAQKRFTWSSQMKTAWRGIFLPLIGVWDHGWKSRIYDVMIGKSRDIKHCTDVERLDPDARALQPRLWLPSAPADAQRRDFEAEFFAERWDEKKGDWVVHGHNDFADALKYGLGLLDLRIVHHIQLAKNSAPKPKA